MTAEAGALPTVPSIAWATPFVVLLLCIALLPVAGKRLSRWWHHNSSKLIVSLALAACALAHFASRGFGVSVHNESLIALFDRLHLLEHAAPDGHAHALTSGHTATVFGALGNAALEYIPFITLLFALFCVSGGIAVRGVMKGSTRTNTLLLALGAVGANLIGTTGAAMLLIRPLLAANRERRNVAHTVVFFIFIVCNVGGSLLPIGDPPLFLGYLKGVPFLWTLTLLPQWALTVAILLAVYAVWDWRLYRNDALRLRVIAEPSAGGFGIGGKVNLLWLALVVAIVALIDPSRELLTTGWRPPIFLREGLLLAIVGLSFATTPRGVRLENNFDLAPIGEVAALFVGIFITMQVPLEILAAHGSALGLREPWHFFWATGLLSGVLDNAPTYAVFLQTAATVTAEAGAPESAVRLLDSSAVRPDLLAAVSLGAVFMGAMTYIGNGPNFMVKAIAERFGVAMPSFFAYMLISHIVLLPVLLLVTMVFFR